jgi:class 3 adenylate cyclase/tetratricopeptide (TPR) repeat protein
VERKLATVLFVDLVGSTALLSRSDPEVVRRRMNAFFEQVSHDVRAHGGIVEKYAGDAVLAAFGIPQAHEDDALRAVRAALAVRESVCELELDARMGIESGEVVVDEADSTFATGEAVNIAARLQQLAEPGAVLLGPGACSLAAGKIETEELGEVELRGVAGPVRAFRLLGVTDEVRAVPSLSASFVGRDADLELLENIFERAVRDRRAHLLTIFGEPGVGKSRLAQEFLAGLERATVLAGRCLPYGEGVTYWPLAEMVKASAGITDDDSIDEAFEKLKAACEAEEIADLLGIASGLLEAVVGERSQQEIAWAARKWVETEAEVAPLVLVFEDVHWAEEPLLALVEDLAARLRESPVLLICLARPELLDARPGWGGGRLRATTIELEPLPIADSEALVDALLDGGDGLDPEARQALLEKTEGNPLFLEETIRMLLEQGGPSSAPGRIPDTEQALIASRIDRLPAAEKAMLQRAAVMGRVFWSDALAYLAPDAPDGEAVLDDLLQRELVLREPRSTISDERAYRFKHVLIREVAYGGLSKSARARHHARFAAWLRERTGEELLEIRAYHLDQAATLAEELDGAVSDELRLEAAEALERAGRRALWREANASARKLFLRAVELEPTLERRYQAAAAASELTDLPAVSAEMERVLQAAEEIGDRRIQGRALVALAQAALSRAADVARASELGTRALELTSGDDEARYDALSVLSTIGWWEGNLTAVERHVTQMIDLAHQLGRKDLESGVLMELARLHHARLEDDEAEALQGRAVELAEESGSFSVRAFAARFQGDLHLRRDELDEAEACYERSRTLFAEAGVATSLARTLNSLAQVHWRKGDLTRAEDLLREAIRILKPLEDRGTAVESQRRLAQVLLEQGKLDEAERYALESRETVGPRDMWSRSTTALALGLVRAAQARDDEAAQLLRESVDVLAETDFRHAEIEPLRALTRFLRERGRADEAAPYEARLAELRTPAASPARTA